MHEPDSDSLSALGRELASHRHRLELSQEELAELTGLHRTYIGSIERGGRNPTVTSLIALCSGLNCKASELLAAAGL